MKITAAITFLFATLTVASPAPVAQPEALVAAIARPQSVEAREANTIRSIQIEARAKKPSGGSSSNSTSAAISVTPTRVLQVGALGLGMMEVVRLWG